MNEMTDELPLTSVGRSLTDSGDANCAAVLEVARLVREAGGRALLVGGCVRDELLGGHPKDLDVECFGIAPEKLQAVLSTKFSLDLVGLSFGVIKLHHLDVDIALPRRETKLGLGHRAFGMEHDPNLSIAEASARRDFTVNAIYKDPLTGEILDPWNGRADLEKRILRHVSSHFGEDPLRVLRGMQFVARFDLEPAPETIAVCREMTPEGLPPERLFEEWAKLLTKGVKISKGLEFLRAVGWVRYYPELERLIGCEQAPEWHPEGDVWNHTLCCLDAFARQKNCSIVRLFDCSIADDSAQSTNRPIAQSPNSQSSNSQSNNRTIEQSNNSQSNNSQSNNRTIEQSNNSQSNNSQSNNSQSNNSQSNNSQSNNSQSNNRTIEQSNNSQSNNRTIEQSNNSQSNNRTIEQSNNSQSNNRTIEQSNNSHEDLIVGLAVLCHDFGKPATSVYDPVKKRIRSLGHDEAGVEPTLSFLRRLTNEERLLKEVPPLVQLHMRPFAMWKDQSGDNAIRRLAAKVVRIDRLVRVAAADDAGRPPFPSEPGPLRWLIEQAERLRVADSAPKPLVQGRDLIALGMKPGVQFGRILKAAYEAQLDGAFFDLAGGIRFVQEKCIGGGFP